MYQVSVQIETKKNVTITRTLLVGSKRQGQKNITFMREDKKNIVMQNLV